MKLSEIATKHGRNYAFGYLDRPFRLRITRSGCEFDDLVSPPTHLDPRDGWPIISDEEEKVLDERLKMWHTNAQVSGYGDVREQVTRVNSDIRQAREIPASDFTVEPELLARIADLWDQHFFPKTTIRVQPYKIHVYELGDHFRVHRDTPQKDLIGTFLLGLGDTTFTGGLKVDGKECPAHVGSWCAFYPDMPHSVAEVDGHRASLAFQVFRAADTDVETPTSVHVRGQLAELVEHLEPPFGILLQHKYSFGTTSFSSFDALVTSSVHALPHVQVRQFPVVIDAYSSRDYEDRDLRCRTAVYPFTGGHIDALLAYPDTKHQPKSHAECGEAWIDEVKNVPFFSLDFSQSLYTYKEQEQDEIEHTGNESRPWTEDSVYLSYALLALPKTNEGPEQVDEN